MGENVSTVASQGMAARGLFLMAPAFYWGFNLFRQSVAYCGRCLGQLRSQSLKITQPCPPDEEPA